MGLDQYLYAKKYTSNSEFFGEKRREEFLKLREVVGDDARFLEANLPSITIEMKVGYWRKANAVHQWFVDNCQNGEDDCREAYVGREKLEELLSAVKAVIADPSKADDILPTQSGFFFGSTEYDEYYFQDLKDTKEILERCLSMSDEWDFAYQSSW